jgi:hypothetical protein
MFRPLGLTAVREHLDCHVKLGEDFVSRLYIYIYMYR